MHKTSQTHEIDVGKQYTKYPAGSLREHGPHSGQRFREEFLLPALEKLPSGQKLMVRLDGAHCSSGFLRGAFGGLALVGSPSELVSRIQFVTRDRLLLAEIQTYLHQPA